LICRYYLEGNQKHICKICYMDLLLLKIQTNGLFHYG
jgi:hypothetical protein